jgi:hypothetical protein
MKQELKTKLYYKQNEVCNICSNPLVNWTRFIYLMIKWFRQYYKYREYHSYKQRVCGVKYWSWYPLIFS